MSGIYPRRHHWSPSHALVIMRRDALHSFRTPCPVARSRGCRPSLLRMLGDARSIGRGPRRAYFISAGESDPDRGLAGELGIDGAVSWRVETCALGGIQRAGFHGSMVRGPGDVGDDWPGRG